MVKAKGLKAFDTQKLRQGRVIAQRGVLIQGQVDRVKGKIMLQKEFDPFPVSPRNSQRAPPEKAVVDKEQARAGPGGPFKGFKACVHGKGDLVYLTVIVNLYTIEGTIHSAKTIQVQKAPEKLVQFP
jgi:hypothetical protein